MKFKIFEADRPEDDKWTPPTYHEMLEHLCDELGVPGAHDFKGAVAYVKRKIQKLELLAKLP